MELIERIRAFAAAHPRHPALIVAAAGGAPDRVSYAQLVAGFEARAAAFRAAGARPGDRCGLLARQGRGFVEAALGMLAADLCMVPIPDDTGDQALVRFAEAAHLHALADERRGFALERLTGGAPVDGEGDVAFRALRPAYLRFTSGTTHERKGVILGAEAISARLDAANRGLRIGPDDRVIWLLPMAHHFVVSILLYLRHGATLLLPGSSLAAPVLELAERAGATVCYASPYHYTLLGKDRSERGLDDVRLAVSTATGLREEVALRFRERFGRPIVQALGIIEVGLPVMNLASAERKPCALGRPLPGYEVWLRDEDGRPLPPDARGPAACGELCIRGPGLFDAYLDPWCPSSRLCDEDGFRTGDQAWLDEEGDLFLAGRRANRISMAGMKFFAEEVEAVLDRHPGVRASRVRAEQHEQLGEFPVAEIVPRDPAAPPATRDLVRHCREQLPAYKVPRRFEPVATLPLTETGKLRRWRDAGSD